MVWRWDIHPPTVTFRAFVKHNFMQLTRQIDHIFQVVFCVALGMVTFLIKNTFQHMPDALCDQLSSSAPVVQVGIVLEDA